MTAKIFLVLSRLLSDREVSMLIISLLEKIAAKTTNRVDDIIVNMVKQALFQNENSVQDV